jgi:hypothetical protein
MELGYKLVSGGTDNHLVLVDLRPMVSLQLDNRFASTHNLYVCVHGCVHVQYAGVDVDSHTVLSYSVVFSNSGLKSTMVFANIDAFYGKRT